MHNNQIYILAFLVPFLVMMVIFAIARIYPFGDRSFLHIDMYHQYFPFLTDMYHAIRGGSTGTAGSGLAYSFNGGLGVNFAALYDYYLSSPLNYLSILISEKHLMEFLSYGAVLKIGLSGASFAYYLNNHRAMYGDASHIPGLNRPSEEMRLLTDPRNMSLIFFSTFYAMSGYIAAYNWDVMWLDVIALSPIVILGLERLVISEGREYRLYTISLAIALICNYYLCIMLSVFLVLYYLMVLLPDIIPGMKENALKRTAKTTGFFAGYSLMSGCMAAIVLIPSYMAIRMTKFVGTTLPTSYKSYFPVFDIFARHLLDVKVETGLDHWPNIYASVAVLILIPLYVICRQIPTRVKAGRLTLLSFMFYSFSVNLLSFLWHGFNYPDSLPARQSYLYVFLLLTLCYDAFVHLSEYSRNELMGAVFASVGLLIMVQKFVDDDAVSARTIALSAIAVFVYIFLICIYRRSGKVKEEYAPVGGAGRKAKDIKAKADRMKVLMSVVLMVVIVESGVNMKLTSVPTVSRDNYLKGYEDYEYLYDTYNELPEGNFYRFEREGRLTNNDAMLKAYPSISMFSSIGNGRVNSFYQDYGMRTSKVFYCADGVTPFMRALLGNKYVFVEDKEAEIWEGKMRPADYSEVQTGASDNADDTGNDTMALGNGIGLAKIAQRGEVGLYAFTDTLPVGYMIYTADCDMDELIESDTDKAAGDEADEDPEEEELTPVERQNRLALSLGAGSPLYIARSDDYNGGSADIEIYEDGYYIAYCDTKKADTIKVTAPYGESEYKKLKNPYIINIGYLNGGDLVNVTETDDTSLRMKVYRMDEDVYRYLISKLSEDTFKISDNGYGGGRLKGEIEAGANGYMILSIPYDKGYTVYVDGEKTAASPAMGMMTAVPLGTGRHMIELKYRPQGLIAGVILTLLSIAVFVLLDRYIQKRCRS